MTDSIGQFEIGVSQIAKLSAFDILTTLASQYKNSSRIIGLLQVFENYLSSGEIIDNFINNVLDITTAKGYGLDVWGRIVGVSRSLYVVNTAVLGFQEQSPDVQPFDQGVFYSGGALTGTVLLDDATFRRLVLTKAAVNLSDGSMLSLNNILRQLFPGRGNAYVVNNRDMTMVYKFDFLVTPVERTILTESNILPQPAGVAVTMEFTS